MSRFHPQGVVALALISGLLAAPLAHAQVAPPPVVADAPKPITIDAPKPTRAPRAPEATDVAAPKRDRNGIQPAFQKKHEDFLQRGKAGKMGVLFLGDSITEGWFWGGNRAIWDKQYAQYDPANFGIGGDKTQHVIWRIANGELDGISPKVVVLMIGTNNIGSSADDIYKGDKKIIDDIHAKLPDTKLLVLGIFPRGADPKDPKVATMREKIKEVNTRLAKLDDGGKTRFLDIGDKFLSPNGTLTKDIMPDALHPNAKGYQIWADAMQPMLDSMMR